MAPAPAKAALQKPAVGTDWRAPAKSKATAPAREKSAQERYGNAEVARVLALEHPVWVESKDKSKPGGVLQEDGPEAGKSDAVRNVNARVEAIKPGKPKEEPKKKPADGRVDAVTADEAADKDGKGDAKKKSDEKKKAADAGKPGSKADAGGGGKKGAAKDKEDDGADDGSSSDAVDSRGASDLAVGFEEMPPAPAPRLEGTEAVVVSPPVLDVKQRERIRSQTGLTIAEHYARIQVDLDRLSTRARNEQYAIVTHIDLLNAEVGRDVDNQASLLPGLTRSAIDRVRGACAQARGSIHGAADDAYKSIKEHATDADKNVSAKSLESKEAIANAVLSTTPRIQALHEETMAPIRKVLADTAKALEIVGKAIGEAVAKKGNAYANELFSNNGTPIERAQFERQSLAARAKAEQLQPEFVTAGKAAGDGILKLEPTFSLTFLQIVDPVAVTDLPMSGEAQCKAVDGGESTVRLRLTSDFERANKFVETTADRALKSLEALETAAVEQLAKLGAQLEETARNRGERLAATLLAGQAPAADAWAREMEQVNASVQAGEILDCRVLGPRFREAAVSMDALSTSQRATFDQQSRDAVDETVAAMTGDRDALDQATDAYVDGARKSSEHEAAIRLAAEHFAAGFRGVAEPACSKIGDARASAEEKLGASIDITRKQMAKVKDSVSKSLDEEVVGFEKRLGEPLTTFEADLKGAFDKINYDVWYAEPDGLASRSGRADRAMRRVGTDESAVFDALRGMTPRYGCALEQFWRDHHVGEHDLRWWLDDELSGDEYDAAIAYLDGDHIAGAKAEIKAAKGWFSTDGKQVEAALRGLKSDEITTLKKDDEFIGDLRGQLKSADLKVTDALLAGRVARADALRIKEKIDEAKITANDDKVHDALASIRPDQLAEVRAELADVIGNHAMTDEKPKISDADALAKVTEYIKAPVLGIDPNAIGYIRTRTLSDRGQELAIALIEHGEGSKEARATRAAFETKRSGGPRQERLATALDDRELVDARAALAALPKDANDEKAKATRERAAMAEKNRTEMLTQFATLTGANPVILQNPKWVEDYAAETIGKAYGDSETTFGGRLGTNELARDLAESMVRGGRADPAIAIKFAVKGAGTNEDLIKRTLKGMSAAEIDALKKSYAEKYGEEPDRENQLFDDLGVFQDKATADKAGVKVASHGGFFTELSGDDKHDVEELLLGKPENDKDQWRLARLKAEHQRGEGSEFNRNVIAPAIGDALVAPGMGKVISDKMFNEGAGANLDNDRKTMEAMVDAWGGPDKAFDEKGNIKPIEGKFTVNDFRSATSGTREAAETYKAHIDSIASMVTGAIAIIGAIVGTIVVTVLSLGTATPFVIGAWAAGIAAATGAAAMAANYAIKGNRYGWEEAGVDAALTLLDAATAGLMAGAGAKAARAAAAEVAAIKAAARTPAQVAAVESLVAKQAKKEVARGFVRAAKAGGISGTARTALADGTWDDGVLTGLGRTFAGGAKASLISVASHGAGHVFNTTIGHGLTQSTSYIGRGLGTGISGAVSGMAGRGTELTLDALGGHAQGSFEDNLLSVVAAGGRGFVENVGHGIAEVPKARRDAAEAQYKRRAYDEGETQALRTGKTGALDEADAAFRMKALRTARAIDPAINPKKFLANLDAAVAADRATFAANRETARKFRTEALAGIPPARRAEFANTPIRVLADADFEKLTGSKAGQAVTLIVDGEAQIVVRKSATPETLREEGIHVLQSRDPKWRAKVEQLDEKTMSRWNELDLETQLKLYRNKIEIEIDGQQRLRRNLVEDAERATDPAQRRRLLDRVADADESLASLRARQVEVAEIGPERISAIRRGTEARPQYLREPPRLFNKRGVARGVLPASALGASELDPKRAKVTRDHPLTHDDDLTQQKSYAVELENSTWANDFPRNYKVRQIGAAWSEVDASAPDGKRWYRMAELLDDKENFVDRRREILQLEENVTGGKIRWQQRGSETSERGSQLEQTSRQRTMDRARQLIIAARRAAGTLSTLGEEFLPNEDLIVPIGALRKRGDKSGRPLSAQHGGGAGFDDVKFEFRKVGRRWEATIVIVEAKGYRRSLTLEDFSAITANMDTNLAELRKAIRGSNLSLSRKEAIYRAIAARDLGLEIHLSPTSELGRMRTGGTIVRDIKDTEMARRQLGAVEARLKSMDRETLSSKQQQVFDDDVARVQALRKELDDAYKSEPFRYTKVRQALDAILDSHGDDSAIGMARRNKAILDTSAVDIQRQKIDVKGADAKYARQAAAVRAKAGQRTQTAFAIAQDAALADKTFRPSATSHTAPADVSLHESTNGARSLAITRPSVGAPGNENEGVAAASRQIVKLLRDGVPVPGGETVHPDKLVWDAASASPAQIEQVLKRVRQGLAADNGDPTRLHVLVEGTVADTEAELRSALSLPGSVGVTSVVRTPDGTPTWVLSFPLQWRDGRPNGRSK